MLSNVDSRLQIRQASEAPAEPPTDGFDFDAHIAKLIAASEMDMKSELPPRGWEDGVDMSRIIRRPKHGQIGDDEEFFEDEFEDDGKFDGEVAAAADPLLEEQFAEVCPMVDSLHFACLLKFLFCPAPFRR